VSAENQTNLNLSQKVIELIKNEFNLTYAQIAASIGVSRQCINGVVRGSHSLSAETLDRAMSAYGLNVVRSTSAGLGA